MPDRKPVGRYAGGTRVSERRLSARSVIASTLLGVHPPVLPAAVLVRSGELFGMRENATRVALSRMVSAGEVEAVEGEGPPTYRLAGHLLERQARQDISRRPPNRRWNGQWVVAIVTAERRDADERNTLRVALARARFAELREGVWTRPDNLGHASRPVAPGCIWASARFAETPTLWDLGDWSSTAGRLHRRLTSELPRLDAQGVAALAGTFVLSAAVLRHLQADPLLPSELLPASWPGPALRATYDRFDARFKAVWRDWHRSIS